MAYVAVGLFVLVVSGLAWLSHRSGTRARGCCAPADPADDLRMRSATPEDRRTS
jgi:hypothetical protein